VLRGVSGVFPSSVGTLRAGVLVAKAKAGARATVTWSEETDKGERTLFVQHAAVRPRSVLYAAAHSPKNLRQGLYRVHASVAGDEHDATFVIVSAGVVPRVRAGPGKSVPLRVGSAGDSTGADLEPGPTEVDDTPDPCAEFTDPAQLEICQKWYGTGPGTEPDAVDDTPTTTRPCPTSASAWPYIDQETWRLGGYVNIHASSSSTRDDCPPVGDVDLSGAVAGGAPGPLAQAADDARWSGETCDLPGASDLFGDKVTARAAVGTGESRDDARPLIEFGPLPAFPLVSPAAGSLVKAGTRIEVAAIVVVEGATRGIKSMVMRAQDGTELARRDRAQPAVACEKSTARFFAYALGRYKVPRNPPPIIEITVSAETFDGSRVQVPIRYSTKPTWSGTLRLTVDQDVPSSGHQHEEYQADVVVSETNHDLEGRMHGPWTQTLDLAHCPSETITAGRVTAPLTGTVDARGMHLKADAGTATPPTVTPCEGGLPPGLMGNPLLYPELAQLLGQIDSKGSGTYSRSIDVTEPGGGYPYKVHASMHLEPGADVADGSPNIDVDIALPRS
jgi:hypothetical protein